MHHCRWVGLGLNCPRSLQSVEIGEPCSKAYDIALVRLETDVDLSVFTPACLARAEDATTFNYEKTVSLGEKYREDHLT